MERIDDHCCWSRKFGKWRISRICETLRSIFSYPKQHTIISYRGNVSFVVTNLTSSFLQLFCISNIHFSDAYSEGHTKAFVLSCSRYTLTSGSESDSFFLRFLCPFPSLVTLLSIFERTYLPTLN